MLTKYKEDYEALLSRLSTLPDKVTHQVFVPIGTKAFAPGKMKHTNEILVLLGDNWFVERSAKQACEIVQRRIKCRIKLLHKILLLLLINVSSGCQETLAGFEKELALRSGWKDQTQKLHDDLNQTVNIIEQEDDDSWRGEQIYSENMSLVLQWLLLVVAVCRKAHWKGERIEKARQIEGATRRISSPTHERRRVGALEAARRAGTAGRIRTRAGHGVRKKTLGIGNI